MGNNRLDLVMTMLEIVTLLCVSVLAIVVTYTLSMALMKWLIVDVFGRLVA